MKKKPGKKIKAKRNDPSHLKLFSKGLYLS